MKTGNGKCNLSNTKISCDNFYSNSKKFIKNLLHNNPYSLVSDFWDSLGVPLESDTSGRIYPYSEQASSVLNALRNEFKKLSIKELCNQNVINISKQKQSFLIFTDDFIICARKLVIACGGMSDTKDVINPIFPILNKLGIASTKCFPALVPITVDSDLLPSVEGVRVKCTISLLADYKMIKKEFGEVQFKKDAISGICAMQLSRLVNEFIYLGTLNNVKYNSIKLSFDFMPEFSLDEIQALILKRMELYPNLELLDILSAIINKKLCVAIIKASGFKPSDVISNLNKNSVLNSIPKTIKNFKLQPTGTLDFKNAQAMAGGLNCSQFNPLTLESKQVSDLFAIGEILDVVGDCGGFNLHFAWLSALICANAIGEYYDKNFKYKT